MKDYAEMAQEMADDGLISQSSADEKKQMAAAITAKYGA